MRFAGEAFRLLRHCFCYSTVRIRIRNSIVPEINSLLVAKAFAPMVIASGGRITTTGSIAGTLAAFPGFSAYSGSKYWIEALTDSLAEDMEQQYEATAERELSYKEPDEVSEAFMHALFDENPLRRYMVVPNIEEQSITIRTKVNELVQLNQWAPHSFSRDKLVKMLDDGLAGKLSTAREE